MGTRLGGLVSALVLGVLGPALAGCELVLDFGDHTDARVDDAAVDAMLVPDPCTVLEGNDDVGSAIALTTGENRYAAICPSSDLDFYKVTLVQGQTLDFQVLFKNANGDLDMELYDATGTSVVAESRSFDDNEEIKCPNDVGMTPTCPLLNAGDYIVKVFPAVAGTTNVYRLSVTIAP
jgi:Bacterial pre-peptidase C-terminal domain